MDYLYGIDMRFNGVDFFEIPGFGDYMVSRCGLFLSVKRSKYKILNSSLNGNGYNVVHLFKNGKRNVFQAHRIVAAVFLGNPENKPEVNHINGVKSDNRANNLEWVTRSENRRHAFMIGLQSNCKENNPRAKITSMDADSIRKMYSSGKFTQKQIGEFFGITQMTVSAITTKKNWK